MADEKGGETIRSIISGFNTMQQQLGLLPVGSGQMPMGVPPNQPPPPLPMPHPSEYAWQVSQQQQALMQQTVQAAQMTRYTPPPSSAPGFSWGNSYAQMGANQFNPMVANAMGGGAAHGMPNPMYATAPQYGMYRPPATAGSMMSPMAMRPPAIFNPLAAQMPAPHFMSPAMQSYQILQARQAESAGLVGGGLDMGLGLGGSMLGGALGTALGGPLGGIAGSWLGGKVGGFMSDASVGPAFADIRRGRQMQGVTSPFMVSGQSLNPFTSQGMSRGSANDLAQQMRTMTRDPDMHRTGFNTQDIMRITQMASDQGLLQAAQNPDEIARKIKDISKSLKTLIQVTGDPDVRNAIAHLGQMRQLGFEGLGGQMGAVANRAAFSRMAGVSQSAMHEQFGMPGAMMAQGLGLAGATGYHAGMGGGGMANVAVSGGAMSDLQLARAGGKQGLGQMNAMAALGAINQDVFMGASLRVGKNGEIDVDPAAYRRATEMSVSGASNEMGRRMASLSPQQLMSYQRMAPELKDKLAQTMSPIQMQMNAIRQAQSLMQETGTDLGGALQVMTGGNTEAARALELEWSSKGFYSGMEQQLRGQRREAGDRERARRENFRTPGLLTNVGRGARGLLGAASDAVVNPVAALMERSARGDEEIAAELRGERVERFSGSELIRTDRDRRRAASAAMNGGFDAQFAAGGSDPYAGGDSFVNNGRSGNRMSRFFGFGGYNDANLSVAIANESERGLFGLHTSYGDVSSARSRLGSLQGASSGILKGQRMNVDQAVSSMMNLQSRGQSMPGGKGFNARAIITQASRRLMTDLPKAGAAGMISAGSAGIELFEKHLMASLKDAGMSESDARQYLEANREELIASVSRDVYLSGDHKAIETLENTVGNVGRLGGLRGKGQRDALQKEVGATLEGLGLEKGLFSDKAFEQTKQLIKDNDPKVLALAAAKQAMLSGSDAEKETATRVMSSIQASFGSGAKGQRAYEEANVRANAIHEGASGDVRGNLRKMLARGGRGGFEEAQGAVDRGMAGQAISTALKKMEEATGQSGLQDKGLEGAAMNMSEDQVKALTDKDKRLGSAVAAYRKGKPGSREALYNAVVNSGAKGTTELYGGEQGGTGGIDRQISDLADMRDKLAKSDRPEDKTAALFAIGVVDFVQASKDLRIATENMRLNQADPLNLPGGR